jgi:hypothetical protein
VSPDKVAKAFLEEKVCATCDRGDIAKNCCRQDTKDGIGVHYALLPENKTCEKWEEKIEGITFGMAGGRLLAYKAKYSIKL